MVLFGIDLMYVSQLTSSGIGAPAFRQVVEIVTYGAGTAILFFQALPYVTKKIKARKRLAAKQLRGTERLNINGVSYV